MAGQSQTASAWGEGKFPNSDVTQHWNKLRKEKKNLKIVLSALKVLRVRLRT